MGNSSGAQQNIGVSRGQARLLATSGIVSPATSLNRVSLELVAWMVSVGRQREFSCWPR